MASEVPWLGPSTEGIGKDFSFQWENDSGKGGECPPCSCGLCVGSRDGGAQQPDRVSCPAADYFSAYLGEYRNVLSALETLNAAVLAAMDKTKLVRMALGRAAGQLRVELEPC